MKLHLQPVKLMITEERKEKKSKLLYFKKLRIYLKVSSLIIFLRKICGTFKSFKFANFVCILRLNRDSIEMVCCLWSTDGQDSCCLVYLRNKKMGIFLSIYLVVCFSSS